MYLFTNAIKNLGRNKGRNMLIAVITLAIIISTVVTLTINNAAARVVDDIRLDLGSRVSVRQDFIEMRQMGLDGRRDAQHIPLTDFVAFSESEFLRHTTFSADVLAWSDSLFAIDDPNLGEGTRVLDDGSVMNEETLRLVTISDPELLPDFGTLREIVDGRMFDGINEAVISEALAAHNDISVGDTIEIIGAYATDRMFSLTVVGIYSDATDEYLNPWITMFGLFPALNRRNEIIASFDTLLASSWETNAGLDIDFHYFLSNPDYLEAFEVEVRAMGLPFTYNVDINRAAFERVTGPLAGISSAAFTFMVVVLVLGAITLGLMSYMAVRERKYEVGVLRAMGLERGRVAIGIISEAVMIAAVCLVIGLGVGSAVAQPIANGMLSGRVAEAEAVENPGANRALFAGGQMQIGDGTAGYVPVSEIQLNLGVDIILQIIIITLGLAALTSIIGVVIITQYEPLIILRERT
ncbi:MAG: FtsX-like permease family protein [Defluviitaleaceae bacterium]|nr:FtsX-like permease family protein [Defluviitaleaceae bacterium]